MLDTKEENSHVSKHPRGPLPTAEELSSYVYSQDLTLGDCRCNSKEVNVTVNELGFPGGAVVKNPPANAGKAGDMASIPGSGRSPGEGKGYPLQYSCLENSMDRGAWWAIVHGVAKSQPWLNM